MLALALWTLTSCAAPQDGRADEVDAATRERLVGRVVELRTALRAKDHARAREVLDLGALLNRALALEPHPDRGNLFWRWGVTTGWLQGLVDEAESCGDELSVRSVRRAAAPGCFEVLTHTVDADGLDTYEWWELRDADGTARIVDTMDADVGSRGSEWLAATLRLERLRGRDVDAWLRAVEQAESLLGFGLYEAAREHLEASPSDWPVPMAQTIETLHVAILLAQERWQPALARIRALEEANPDALLTLHMRAQALVGLGRFAEAQAALGAYERAVGGSDVTTLYHRARALAGAGEDDAARAALERALERDPDDPDLLYELALVIPRWDPEPLRTRFLAMDDPRGAFEPLAIAFLDEGHYDAAEALCRIQRAADPGDPNPGYYLGRLHLELDQYESAAQVVKEVLPLAPEEELAAYQELFLDACLALGVGLSGYEACPDRAHAFRYLAEGMLLADGPDGVRRTIERHRLERPDDPWIAYHEALLARHEGESAEALARLRAGLQAARAPELREAYRSALVGLAIEEGQARTIWRTVEPVDASFDQVLGAAFDARDLELFGDLLRERKQARPDDPLRDFYRALRLHLEGRDARALAGLRRNHDDVEEHGAHVFRRDLAYVLSALRTGRIEAARRRALAVQEDWGDDYLLLLVHTDAGEHERAVLLLRRTLRRGWSLDSLYEDEHLGALLREHPAYDELRAEYPPLAPEEEAEAR